MKDRKKRERGLEDCKEKERVGSRGKENWKIGRRRKEEEEEERRRRRIPLGSNTLDAQKRSADLDSWKVRRRLWMD